MSTPFLSEIKMFSFGFAPKGWALCNGQTLPINQNQALFALLGTNYGGNGQTTFQLPNLQGRVPIHFGSGTVLAETGGATSVTIIQSTLPAHSHPLNADATTTVGTVNSPAAAGSKALGRSTGVITPPGTFTVSMYNNANPTGTLNPAVVTNTGGNQPHNNMQPFLTINFSIALQGIFPSQN